MDLEKQLHEELKRHHSINNYGKRFIGEQEEPADPTDLPTGDEPVGDAPVDDAGGVDVEEVDITDLVNMTQNIKNELDAKKGENDEVIGKMGDLFSKLDDLESKLSQMDNVIAKIDGLENKVETMKEPSAQEKLEMRSLDSYPFNQKPTDFFSQKQLDMKASGKNEYILTKQDVEDYNDKEMRDSFNIEPNDENEVEW